MSVEEKRRSLAQDLRQAIMNIHYGYTKLREFNNNLVSAKRLLVSLRMASFVHYNWLEDKIENIQGEVVALKNRITNQAENISKQIAAETKGLMDYTNWSATQFPFIEGVTNRVSHISNQYKTNVDDALKDTRFKLDEIKRQLEGLDYYRKKFAGFYEVSELSVNELPVCALPDIRVTGSDFLRHDKATGTLYITNRRLIFAAETGIVRKKMDILFDFPLLYLNSIEEDGRIRKRLVLKLKQGELKIASSDQTQKVLPDYIEIARKFDRYMQTDLQRVRKLEQQNMNVSDVRMKIEGLVHSLLSPGPQPYDSSFSRTQRGVYRTRDWQDQGGRTYPYNERSYTTPDFREELRHVVGDQPRYEKRQEFLRQPREPENRHRNIAELDRALSETVELLRTGRIIPEDFIRRYRLLMRDSYEARRGMERQPTGPIGPRW
ncbi:MAG: hypothetical protein ACFFF4_08420 [Candidatus Thorarchaeota archaeon]